MAIVERGRIQPERFTVEQPDLAALHEPRVVVRDEWLHSPTALGKILAKGRVLLRPEGINASLDGFFQRPFGRDTFYTSLGLLATLEDFGRAYVPEETLIGSTLSFLRYMSRKGLLPHEVGTASQGYPFTIERNGVGRHFGSVDANGLAILVLDKLMHLFPNNRQLQAEALEPMRKMMRWVIVNTVKHDGMIGYTFNSSHGSREKTWQDGQFSIVDFNGALPPHPMHTVLEQGLYWSALLRGADRLEAYYPKLAQKARYSAERIKTLFNRQFVYATDEGFRIARAIDGYGNKIESANIDSLIVLGFDYHDEMILSEANSQRMVEMIEFQMNELETEFGLRTQGISSFLVEGFGYHNKRSLWPFANGVAARALERRSNRYPHFHTTAIRIAEGIEKLLVYFDNPVETAQINEEGNLSLYEELRATTGEVFRSSLVQAWTVGWGTWIDAFLREERARKELI